MKKTIKILTITVLILALATVFSVTAFAAAESAENGGGDENVFAMIYSLAIENADKILSALAFLGTLIVAFAYKKGLFPFIQKTLNGLGNAVNRISEESKRSEELAEAAITKLEEKLASAAELITIVSGEMGKIEAELKSLEDGASENQKIKAVMLSQVEMLYEIFMSSSIPQYQKDRVGESFSKMKARLIDGEAENEN